MLLKIAKYASEWESADTGVRFDFGLYPALNRCDDRSGSYQIRIGFEPTGYWSLVGRDSVLIASQGEQSMNFGRWGAPSAGVSTREMRATVLHEFGHALGLRHAHQNAASTCEDDFAFDRIYPHLAGPPNFWNSKKVDYNLRSIRDRNVQSTKLDKNSIMKYYFPPEFYKTGKDSRCYSEENIELSDGDRATIAAIYPASAVSSIKVANARIESLVTALGDTETAATLRPNSILSRLLKGQQLKIPLNAMVPSDFYTGDRQAVRPGILPQSISRF
ncbi:MULTISPECIES: M66 family metalloprotease [Alphaproteobacteria]|uniref:M66 family metalloprotease n=1 Tax=Alphaproteobacteria TaxID=28211 RepID=UPI003265F3D5